MDLAALFEACKKKYSIPATVTAHGTAQSSEEAPVSSDREEGEASGVARLLSKQARSLLGDQQNVVSCHDCSDTVCNPYTHVI